MGCLVGREEAEALGPYQRVAAIRPWRTTWATPLRYHPDPNEAERDKFHAELSAASGALGVAYDPADLEED